MDLQDCVMGRFDIEARVAISIQRNQFNPCKSAVRTAEYHTHYATINRQIFSTLNAFCCIIKLMNKQRFR